MFMQHCYIIYYEYLNPDFEKVWNSNTVQCDTFQELLYQLRQSETKGFRNVIITTIQNAQPQ